MSFTEYIAYRIKYFWFIYILNRQCGMCMGSNGHCDVCDEWKHLYKRNWKRDRLKRVPYPTKRRKEREWMRWRNE